MRRRLRCTDRRAGRQEKQKAARGGLLVFRIEEAYDPAVTGTVWMGWLPCGTAVTQVAWPTDLYGAF